jgi:hypothetical protein
MYKLLLGLGIIDLAFQFPHLTTLTIVGVFLYNNLSDDELSQIKSTAMSIYSNGKEFTKYLTRKAQELKVSIKDLRQQVVTDLEIPKAAPDYTTAFTEPELTPEQLKAYESFASKLNEEELNLFNESEVLHEKLYRVIAEAIAINNAVWVEASLWDCLMNDYEPDGDWCVNYQQEFEEWGIHLDWNKTFTEKDYRQLKMKLKALSRNPDGSIKDEELVDRADIILGTIHDFFTDYQFCQHY